ncbi:MAG TPA: HAMP domain-containing sensor histidine kinase [Candidatus Saccharimonadales bacterium]|nr:HAMP domain-containing sensor histidine kinase [Candidatus Saccharimonadales bacterium]
MKKKFAFMRRISSKTARLALSYLAIIMALSVGFSTILYFISSSELNKQLAPPESTKVRISVPGRQDGEFFNVSPSKAADGAALTYRRQQVAQSKQDVLYKLAMLNASMLIAGAGLSYILARRTLRPIEAALQAQGQFASNVSHELRTPLAAMQLEIENGLRTLTLAQPAKRLLMSNLEELAQLTELSEAMLRLAQETEDLAVTSVWVDEIVSKAMSRVVKNAQAKQVSIVDTTPHTALLASSESFLETLVILLENAITYGPPRAKVIIQATSDKKYGYVRITDEGPGIAPEDAPHIFDRFYRGTSNTDGHGLGLSIAQTLATRQHGELTVENAPDKGAMFTIKLPLYRSK